MAKTNKTTTQTVPAVFGWISTKDGKPHVKKSGDNPFKISNMLLLHSRKHGRTPGYFVEYHHDHLAAVPPRTKGDQRFHSADGTVLEDVDYFFEIKDIPAPEKAKEPAKTE